MIPIIYNIGKCKLIYSDLKQISNFLGTRRVIERLEGQIRKGHGETLGKGIILFDMIVFLWMCTYIKFTELYFLIMWSYVHYDAIKL